MAVSPSLHWADTIVNTRLNILAGIVCTSSSNMSPHSWSLSHSITFSVSYDRLVVSVIIEYVVMRILAPIGLSFASWVKRQIVLSSAVDHILNCVFHCSTETPELQRIRARLLIVHAVVTPTSVLPAPQGNTFCNRIWLIFNYKLSYRLC